MSEKKLLRMAVSTAALALAASSAANAQALDAKQASSGSASETAPAKVAPLYGDITPFYGDIDPFYGDINPFYGDINPFYGDINPFYGDVDPLYGDIDPFYGDIDPFYGDILPFYGDINPFYGDINPFYGDINPFYGDINPFWGTANPLYGDINPFYGDILPFYGDIMPFWTKLGSDWRGIADGWAKGASGDVIAAELTSFVDETRRFWAGSVEAHGDNFDFVASDVFARYGFDLQNPESFVSANTARRERFMLDWYDTFMQYSGRDAVDHWMVTAKWTPALTQMQGSGADSVIGLLDGTIENDPDLLDNLGWAGGYTASVNGHGASVASLMVGAHDGTGVMGIAPRASVLAYNPFDETGTTNWGDIHVGVEALVKGGANVVNLSLGSANRVVGSEWGEILASSGVAPAHGSTVFVKAAGNDGAVQTEDVLWNAPNAEILFVGSVDPNGFISHASNRPGDACLVSDAVCTPLMDRFIVAPGEMILMSDGEGGLVRRSGTSFSAPIVSGAIALLHDRWPWLEKHAEETAEIILATATDLGEEGTDAVYGRGLLNIEASQSPLSYDRLYAVRRSPSGTVVSLPLTKARVAGTDVTWSAEDAYVVAFETIGDTRRDFMIPLDSQLFGKKKFSRATGQFEFLQSYLTSGFEDWWKGAGYSDVQRFDYAAGEVGISMSSTPIMRLAQQSEGAAVHNEVTLALGPGRSSLTFGHGLGVMAMSGDTGFFHTSDYAEGESGIDPVMGFASGGPFLAGYYEINPFFALSAGVTGTDQEHDAEFGLTSQQRAQYDSLENYRASAVSFAMHMRPADSITLRLGYTGLSEDAAVLGVQAVNEALIGEGAKTSALTFSGRADLGAGFGISASMTAGSTVSDDRQALLRTDGDLLSTAFVGAVDKMGLLAKEDFLRVSVEQPLHVESGRFTLDQFAVADRSTGELALETSSFSGTGEARPLNFELRYAAPLFQTGTVGFFSQVQTNAYGSAGSETLRIGASIGTRF